MKVKEILAEAKKVKPNTWVWIEKPLIFKTIKIEALISKLENDDPEKDVIMEKWEEGGFKGFAFVHLKASVKEGHLVFGVGDSIAMM